MQKKINFNILVEDPSTSLPTCKPTLLSSFQFSKCDFAKIVNCNVKIRIRLVLQFDSRYEHLKVILNRKNMTVAGEMLEGAKILVYDLPKMFILHNIKQITKLTLRKFY